MKYAKSLSKLGELVEANTADYDTFKDFLLVCPHCSSSIYLVQAHRRSPSDRQLTDRVVPVAGSTVPAYFKHHGGEDLECEVYNKSIDSTRVTRSIAIARNQRADIFRSRFIEIFKTSTMVHVQRRSSVKSIEKSIKSLRQAKSISCEVPASLSVPRITLDFSLKQILPIIDLCTNWAFLDRGESFLREELETISGNVSLHKRVGAYATQRAYATEALSFLFARSNKRLLTQILMIAMIEIICLKAVVESHSILKAPNFLDRNFDRNAGINTMVRMFEEDLIANFTVPMYLHKGDDIGMRLPLVATIGMLMTIDWETEFQKYINEAKSAQG